MIDPNEVQSAFNQIVEQMNELQRAFVRLQAQNRDLSARNANRKRLSQGEVERMRRLHDEGTFTQAELAEIFDVNAATVSRIIRRIYWQ